MVYEQVRYGFMSTFNSFVFMKRQSPGVLHMSRLIHNSSTTPTVMKLLYYFSYLCALDTSPHPELDSVGNEIILVRADNSTGEAPRIPGAQPGLASLSSARLNRRSPRNHSSSLDQADSLRLDSTNLTSLGCKGWRGTLSNGLTVFAKLWDGWKFSSQDSEHEASVYYRLRDLWGGTVPEFLGLGNWGFCHILLLSFIEVLSSGAYC
jgi:hypothetical protein